MKLGMKKDSPRSGLDRTRRDRSSSGDRSSSRSKRKSQQKEHTSTSLDRELKKLEDCWNAESPRKDSERHLRSGLCFSSEKKLTPVGDNERQRSSTDDSIVEDSKLTVKERKIMMKKESEKAEETDTKEVKFIRRKKLRSEISEDELWEGILDIRFKRLTPIKVRKEATQTKNEENKDKDNMDTKVVVQWTPDVNESFNDQTSSDLENERYTTMINFKNDDPNTTEAEGTNKASKECRKARSSVDLFDELLHSENQGDVCPHNKIDPKTGTGMEFTDKNKDVVKDKRIDSEICKADDKQLCQVVDKNGKETRLLSCEQGVEEVEYSVFKVIIELMSSMVSTVEERLKNEKQKNKLKQHHVHCNMGKSSPAPKRSARIYEKQQQASSADRNSVYLYTGLRKSDETCRIHANAQRDEFRSVRDTVNLGIDESSSLNIAVTSENKCTNEDHRMENTCMQSGSEKLPLNQSEEMFCKNSENCIRNQRRGQPVKIGNSLDKESDDLVQSTSQNEVDVKTDQSERQTDDDKQKDNNGHESKDRIVSLKFKVRKTENGATIIPLEFPSSVITKTTKERMMETIITPNEKKLSAKLKANTAQNSPKLQDCCNGTNDTQNKCTKKETERNKQTRSRTRSGEGEITDPEPDPETLLKQPRVKGKNLSFVPKDEQSRNIKSRSKKRKISLTPEKKSPRSKRIQPKQQRQSKLRSSANDKDLLKNQCLAKHACVLWSSEQRRYFQLSHSGSSSEEIDQIMREAWTTLDEKEKLRYFQRAYSATTDENKHSELVKPGRGKRTYEEADDRTSKAIKKFQSMNCIEQYEELIELMRMLNDVSSEEYSKLMCEFRTDLKSQRQKRKERHNPVIDTQGFCRNLLFSNIMNKMDILELYQNKKEKQKHLIKEAFDVNTKRLIDGDKVSFSPDAHSDRLSEVLLDLKTLEDEKKIAVSGTILKSDSYNEIVNSIEKAETELNGQRRHPDLLKDMPEIDCNNAKEVLSHVSSDPLTELTGEEVEDFIASMDTICKPLTTDEAASLADYFENKALLANSSSTENNTCCDLDSPSCVLTSLLMSDKLRNYVRNQTLYDGGGHIDVSKLMVRPARASDHDKPSYKVRTVLMKSMKPRMYTGNTGLHQSVHYPTQKLIVKETKYPRTLQAT